MHYGGTTFVILFFGDPAITKASQTGQNGSTDPHGVFAFRWRAHFNWYRVGYGVFQLLVESLAHSGIHCGAARQHYIGE